MKNLSGLPREWLSGKTALVRVDFNLKTLADPFKVEAILPTINFLLARGARVVLMSHRGRPEAEKNRAVLTLRPFVPLLKKLLREPVGFLVSPESPAKSKTRVFLLENLRFFAGEEKNDPAFARKLAALGDLYVNDAFAVSHRHNASVAAIADYLPAFAGLLLTREVQHLSSVMRAPRRPLVAVFGGAKIADKIDPIKNLLPKSAAVLLGSAAVNSDIPLKSKKIIRPKDWLAEGGRALDVGPLTVKEYLARIKSAKTIIWNGPLGLFEDARFAGGSIALAKAIAKSKAFSIVGGGETTQLIKRLKLDKKISFLSTGGGAMLAYLAGEKMPGIKALK